MVEYAEGRTDHVIEANWKIVVENYIDVYHLSHLHSETLYMYDHSRQQSGFVGPHFMFYEPLSKSYAENVEKAKAMMALAHTPARPQREPGMPKGRRYRQLSGFRVVRRPPP